MFPCPQCRRAVDARANASCPFCSAPLNAPASMTAPPTQAPLAGAMPTQTPPVPGRPNVRVSLTGEALEEAPGTSSSGTLSSGSYAKVQPGAPPAAMGRPPLSGPSRPAATPYARREAAPPDNSRRNALLINLSVMLVFLLLCGGGGA